MSGTSGEFLFAEFIDDYFAECDEHLTVARRSLLALEPSVDKPQIDSGLLNELFRSFHSIKGLSAMVGVHAGEQLAHQMESYLSALRIRDVALSAEGMDALFEGVTSLEQIIAARRSGSGAPATERLIARFDGLLLQGETGRPSGPHGSTSDSRSASSVAAEPARGAPKWNFTFVPSGELSARGVNVNSVRERLLGIGELIRATPNVGADGRISFSFLVATPCDEAAFAAWAVDGLTFSPVASEMPVAAAAEPPDIDGIEPDSSSAPSRLMPSNVVRVDLGRLDELMRIVGELVVSRSRLEDGLQRLDGKAAPPELRVLGEINQAMERQLRDLREGLMRARLVPIGEIFTRMQFVVRDLVREYGKQAVLELNGEATEIDKYLVERMLDPLMHLVRNAVAHGIEPPQERRAAGKAESGALSLRAIATGETILIEIEDDGRGIDRDAVLRRARGAGLIGGDVTALDEAALIDILCRPGFSTRDEADRASGRGVGMSVVRSTIEELGGTLGLDSQPGVGTRFSIQLPLTLAIADALIVDVAGQMYAVPQVAVREVLQLQPSDLTPVQSHELIRYREGVLPLVRLGTVFGTASRKDRSFHALVIGTGLSSVAIGVDRVVGLREIVVRSLNDPLVRVPGISGATELGDGRVVLILDTALLARSFGQRK